MNNASKTFLQGVFFCQPASLANPSRWEKARTRPGLILNGKRLAMTFTKEVTTRQLSIPILR